MGKALGARRVSVDNPMQFSIAGRVVELHTIGIGAVRIGRVQVAGPDIACVILAGLAGALDPQLRVGQVIVDEQSPPQVAQWLGCRSGPIHTAQSLITTAAQKRELYGRTGSLAVDMETQAARRLAEAVGAPFIGVRAISDSAEQSLDARLLCIVDDVGRPRYCRLAWQLLRTPGLAFSLIRVGRDATRAAAHLARAVRRLIEADIVP